MGGWAASGPAGGPAWLTVLPPPPPTTQHLSPIPLTTINQTMPCLSHRKIPLFSFQSSIERLYNNITTLITRLYFQQMKLQPSADIKTHDRQGTNLITSPLWQHLASPSPQLPSPLPPPICLPFPGTCSANLSWPPHPLFTHFPKLLYNSVVRLWRDPGAGLLLAAPPLGPRPWLTAGDRGQT